MILMMKLFLVGGLFALGANTRQNEHTQKFWEVGKGITNTCHESYIRTPTKLGPEAFRWKKNIFVKTIFFLIIKICELLDLQTLLKLVH